MASASEPPDEPSYLSPEATERRVRHLTLIITCAMAVGAGLVWEAGVGAGVAVGGGLAYLNFVWMRASLQSIVATAAAGDAGPARRPSRLQMAKFFSALDGHRRGRLAVHTGCVRAGGCHSMRSFRIAAGRRGGSSGAGLVWAERRAGYVTSGVCASTPAHYGFDYGIVHDLSPVSTGAGR